MTYKAIIDYTDRSKIIEKAFSEWIESFKSENIPEEKRILDYEIHMIGTSESNPNKIRATVEFVITPISKENTTWEYLEPKDSVWQKRNICFIEMTNVDGEYKVDYIGETPKDYDKFLERFEEYKKTQPQTVENVQIQGQKTENNLANQEIEKMSHTIMIGCSICLYYIECIIKNLIVSEEDNSAKKVRI